LGEIRKSKVMAGKKEGINIPVGVDLREFLKGMGLLEDNLLKIPNNVKPAKNAFDELNRTYRTTVRDAQALAVMGGTQSEAFKQATASAHALKTQLEGIHAAVGVGLPQTQKAAGGFNTLSHSVNQITRELPAFTYSMQTGFMAISNNIPMLFDEISRITTANKALVASGQAAPSVFNTLAGSILTWGTALSVGVTALTVLGPQMVNYIGQLDEAAEASKRLADSTKNLIDQENKILAIVTKTNDLRIQAMQEGRAKEEALALQFYKRGIIELEDSYIKGEIVDMTYQQRKQSLWQIYQNKLTDISKNAAKERAKFERQDAGSAIQLDTKTSSLGELATMASGAMQTRVDDTLNKFWTKVNGTNLRGMAEWKANWKGLKENTQESTNELVLNMESVAQGISGAINSMVGAAMRGEDVGKALTISLLGSMGAFMAEWGAQLILVGIGAESLKASLLTLNGVGAIAAGAALVAAGAIAIGTASSMANSQSSGSAGGYTPQGGSSFVQPSFSGTQYLMLDGKVRGQDLVIATSNTRRDNRR